MYKPYYIKPAKNVLSLIITVLVVVLFCLLCKEGIAQTVKLPTFEEYVKNAVPTRQELDIFLGGNGVWARYDAQLGYILGNSMPVEGIDNSINISTTDQNGFRTMQMYRNRPCRINTYGNSFTQCQQVSDGETWQEYLAAHIGEPIRNFGVGGYGVYQSYVRLLREENTKNAADHLIFYVWGDDHVRSLLRCRYLAIKQWNQKNEPGFKFHGNFWPNLEMDLTTGQFIEKPNPLNTKKTLYKMTDRTWMWENVKDDIALQLLLFKNKEIANLNLENVQKLAKHLQLDISFKDHADLEQNASYLLDKYSFAATKYILNKLKVYASKNNKKLLIVLFDPYRVTNSLVETGTRYDDEVVRYLKAGEFNFFDMNLIHVADFKKFNLNLKDYYGRYLLGHYNPTGNHFFAYSIKDKIIQLLSPKPVTYSGSGHNWVDFKGYLQGIN
ncbi:MAG: hypothetical protein EOO91_00175 [Pedobacter sp.]|nr:MAG: hypothetical protein EOO91_00175 [Pedobacter sp.]